MEGELHNYMRLETQNSVLKVKRKVTDRIVGIIFIISFLLWLVAAIYGLTARLEVTLRFQFDNFDDVRIFTLIGLILLNVCFTLMVFIALRWIPRISSVILWIFSIPVLIFVAEVIKEITFWNIHFVIGSILSYLLILILLKWFHLPETILKEACKLIMAIPSTIVFTLLTFLLNACLVVIIAVATLKLINGTTLFTLFLILIINIFGVWILITTIALCWMTLSSAFAEYFYIKNKSTISLEIVWRLFIINCRYHIGTAAMYHPLLGGISALFYVILQGIKTILAGANKNNICFIIYNIFDTVILRIIFLGSATICSIQGKNFYYSLTHTMTLFVDNPKRFLIVVKVTEILITLSGGLVFVMMALNIHRFFSDSFNESILRQSLFINLVVLSGMVCIATLQTCLKAAIYTIMLCTHNNMHMLKITASSDSCIVTPKLYSTLNHDEASK